MWQHQGYKIKGKKPNCLVKGKCPFFHMDWYKNSNKETIFVFACNLGQFARTTDLESNNILKKIPKLCKAKELGNYSKWRKKHEEN